MKLLDRLFDSIGYSPKAQGVSTVVPGSDVWGAFTGGVGGILGEKEALTVSAIYACVNLIAGAISGLPVVQYSGSREAPVRFEDDLDGILNQEMNPRWSAASGWELAVQTLLLPGDGFLRIERGRNGEIRGFEPLLHARVTPFVVPGGRRLIYTVTADPVAMTSTKAFEVVDQDDMLHIPGFGFDGRRGLSPLRHALRIAGSVANATQKYSAEFFQNQARPDFYYKTEQDLTVDQLARMREDIEAIHGGGSGGSHKPGILTNGLDVKAVQLPFEDIQMLATRQFQVEEIARIYGVPPFMIGHTDKTTSWGSGVDSMGINFVKYALRQHITKFENELNRKLLRGTGRFFEFNTHELERADMKTQFEAYRVGVGRAGEGGFVTPGEARRALRLQPKPGDDKLYEPKAAPAGGGPAPDPKET